MRKALIVIFVLSLLGLLAAPVLANVLAETGPYNEVAPLPGTIRSVGPEGMLAEGLIKEGPPPNELCPLPGNLHQAGGEEPVQVARITIRSLAPRS